MVGHMFKDISGSKFNRLTAISVSGRDPQGRSVWMCSCDCGNVKNVPSRHLISGAVKSCGCYGAEIFANNGRVGAAKHSGPLSHLYDPSLTDEDRLEKRNLVELREWRKAVFVKADYVCDVCGERGKKLNAHHLNSWKKYPKDRFEVSNGVCLCKQHHHEFHMSMGGPRKSCVTDDYMKFKARWYLDRYVACFA